VSKNYRTTAQGDRRTLYSSWKLSFHISSPMRALQIQHPWQSCNC